MGGTHVWNGRSDVGPFTPPEYEEEVDPPDAEIAALDLANERLRKELAKWGSHSFSCKAQPPEAPSRICTCGFTLSLERRLWELVEDRADLDEAIESWDDDED